MLLDLDSRVCAYVSPHSPPVWVAPFFFSLEQVVVVHVREILRGDAVSSSRGYVMSAFLPLGMLPLDQLMQVLLWLG